MKKIFKLLLVPALLIVFSCDQETVTDYWPEDLTAITAKGKKHPVPIANALESDGRTDIGPLACAPLFDPPNTLYVAGGVNFYGTVTHLGKVTGTTVNTSCEYIFVGEIPVALSITSDDTIIAANGDKLRTKGAIIIDLTQGNMAPITGGSIIDGGTGRFENATGEFVYHDMVVNLETGHESHTSTGWIMY